MLREVIRFVVAVALAIIALPWCANVLIHSFPGEWPKPIAGIILGLVLGIVAWARPPQWFLHTLIHELAHGLVALLMFCRVHPFSLRVSNGDGGKIAYDAPQGIQPLRSMREIAIGIAPYTVPMILGPTLLLWLFFSSPISRVGLAALISFAYCWHLHGVWHNVRSNWSGPESDLVKISRPLAMVLIIGVLMLVTALTLRTLRSDYSISTLWHDLGSWGSHPHQEPVPAP